MPLNQPYRPQYHVTPPGKWVNDPNGLVFYDGEYHLFFQHNPQATVWGPMHWGHAVSTDLVNWTHLPIALYPDEIGTIFSGSAVIDWQNTAGFGEEAMVAIFTHDTRGRQMQSIAFSTDKGRTWMKYEGNPVLEPPNNIRNFRDPKVFWYETGEGNGHWVMAVSAGNIVLFFTSPDLKNWESSGGFGLTYGATCGVWETPDLFELPVDGGPETRWVLAVAIGDCAPAGGSGVQYFIGSFDGQAFTSENDKETILWADFGADFYAPQSWSDVPAGRRLWLAWMNNWSYAQDIPTSTWRGAFTIPRELALTMTPEGIRLAQRPIAELEQLRDEHDEWRNEVVTAGSTLLDEVTGETLEIIAEFQIESLEDADRFGLRVRVGEDEYTTIGYALKDRTLFVDRMRSGRVDFNSNFPGIHTAVMPAIEGIIRLHIFVDRSSVEVFGNDGQVVFTEQIFPADDSLGLELFVDGGQVQLNALDIYQLDPAAFFISGESQSQVTEPVATSES
ncbi:MAG: glycoside hydrolase family 32 protein [Chloroflexi bacterium]|nr:glycoside hydrolase family 32 protein [Chloroflexota bacterium]MCI0643640.1 glycoside hydrolase family 32 protein [Chloroflexota bacterium]MCI0729819.1 glycoside hydrolase family 32 protein [Chloroflexota bacterium]